MLRQQPPVPSRSIDLDTARDETMREDDASSSYRVHMLVSLFGVC